MKKAIIILIVLAIAGGAFYYWKKHRHVQEETIRYRTQEIRRGNVTEEVTATGIVDPIQKVSVTTQVTGEIIALPVDYNSRVTEGQVIALIDPDTYQSALASQRASLASQQASLKAAEATLERTTAQLNYAEKELTRQKKLAERGMTTDAELDSAQASYDELVATRKQNEASIEQAKAAIEQAKAAVKNAETNLSYCTITSPVTGVVIDRSVDKGQTVVSSMNATALFTIATDLSVVQVEAAIPEADIGGIRVGQAVKFTVDAYKTVFTGKVTQIRLSSTTTSNVVTYPVIVEAENPGEKLFPGMTANLSIITQDASDSVVVPNAATRFTPPNQASASPSGNFQAGSPQGPPVGEGRIPEGFPKRPQIPSKANDDVQAGEEVTYATIWIADSDTEIHPVTVRTGISDGVNTVILDGEELLGKNVVVGKQTAAQANQGTGDQPKNPFMPTPPGRGGNRRGGAGGPPPRM
ncbi:MAG: efflux RND transporter periplasmic adaptor subunit [Victivallales bacterium]|nr:efflux RND transporter periplasmic adaptor subunit [Victivallales bacterium]